MNQVMIFVEGAPCGQPRPRFVGKGRVVSTLRGSRAALWRDGVRAAVRKAMRAMDCGWCRSAPVRVEMHFAFKTAKPKRSGNWHTAKPDTDNLVKLVLDAMQAEGLLGDDRIVASLHADKIWADYEGVSVNVLSGDCDDRIRYPDSTDGVVCGAIIEWQPTEGLGSGGKPEWLN